jgi:hypothetical protein
LCDKVLDPVALDEGNPGVVIIKDLSQSEQYANRNYVKDSPKFRFYAGVPLRSLNHTIVESLCILYRPEGPGRTSISSDEILYLQDLASTIMEYFNTCTLIDQHRRQAEGLSGLISFAEGEMSTQPFDEEFYSTQLPSRTGHETFQEPEQNEYTEWRCSAANTTIEASVTAAE